LGQVFALTETVCEEPIVISAETEPASEGKIKQKKEMVLDIGCGWRKRGNIGLDYGRFAYGRKTCLDVQGYAEQLPFKSETFDKVITNNVFEHVLNAFNFLKECLRVLKPSGLLEIVTDNPYHYMWTVLKPGMGGTEHPDYCCDHYAIYYPENIRRMFRKLNVNEISFSWELKRPRIITFPFANLLVKAGIWRKECLFWTYKIVGRKESDLFSFDEPKKDEELIKKINERNSRKLSPWQWLIDRGRYWQHKQMGL
jgi:ubiquinone/menaquinone biosynthesis C-methylase UbiE